MYDLYLYKMVPHMCGKSLSFDYGDGVRLFLLKLQPVLGPFSITADGRWMDISYIILYHLFSFRGSVQDYKIHMDMEIVKIA